MKKTLAIITTVYENYAATEDFLKSLAKQKSKDFHLFLVNLSKSKSPEGWPNRFPSGVTIINGFNKGYAHGLNLGLKKAIEDGLENFCVINNDVFFNDDFVEKVLFSILDHPSSILGGKIYYAPNFEYHKTQYEKSDLGHVLWYAGGHIDWNHALTPHRGVDEVDLGQYNKFEKISFITGCLMCFDKKVINKIGYLDESYFLYYEDADFCVRAQKNSIDLFYDPSIVIWHKNAQSTEGAGSTIHKKYQQKNRLKFGLKYAPLRTKLHLIKNLFNKSV